MLSSIASLVVDYLSAEDVAKLSQTEKNIFKGPPGKYISVKANNQISSSSLSEFINYVKLRNPNLARLSSSIAHLPELKHLHLLFEYPHILDTTPSLTFELKRLCPLLKTLTLEGPEKYCEQVQKCIQDNGYTIHLFFTQDKINDHAKAN